MLFQVQMNVPKDRQKDETGDWIGVAQSGSYLIKSSSLGQASALAVQISK